MKNLISATTKAALIGAIAFSATQPAQAFFGSKSKKEDVDQNPAAKMNILNEAEGYDQMTAAEQVLQAMAQEMTAKLGQIEELIRSEQNGQALALAKATLDTVRVKTGIDPKAKLQKSFYAPTKFPAGATSMAQLNESEKEVVINTVRDFRGGLYLDIMNLSKRTSLLYVRAFHAQIKKDGGITTEDRNKIIKDLANASIVPLFVVDKLGQKIVAFDEDVANEDHTYMFNREIKMYLLNAKDLQSNEASFEKYKKDYKAYFGGKSIASFSTSPQGASDKCIADVGYLLVGRESNLGGLFNTAAKVCTQTNNNLNGKRKCVVDYGYRVVGRESNLGEGIFNQAMSYCN